jgi:6-phosphogluconolactonase (cycloisomerase 2 family)
MLAAAAVMPVTTASAADGVDGRLAYVTHALSEDIATFTVDRGGSPQRVGDLTSTGADSGPVSVLFAPDGRTVYVELRTSNAVAAYRDGSGGVLTLLGTVSTGGMGPFGLAIAPDGSSLFASNLDSGTVAAFTVNADGTLRPSGGPVATGSPLPRGLAVSPDGRFLYVGHGMPNLPGPDVMVRFAIGRNATLQRVGRPVPINPSGSQIVFTPDGRFLYIATQFNDKVDGFRVGDNGELAPVPGSPYDAARFAEGAVVGPDGRHLFVAGAGDGVDPGGLSAYAINGDGSLTSVAGSPFPAGIAPVGIDTTPDGRRLLVSAGNPGPGQLFTFAIAADGRLNQITDKPLPTGGTAPRFQSLAVQPDQGPTAALTAQAGPAGQTTQFDATAATDPDGHIARFDWNFGDGTTLRDGGPTPAHTYRRPGTYTATVTATDNENCSTALVFTGTSAHCNGSPRARAAQTVTVGP